MMTEQIQEITERPIQPEMVPEIPSNKNPSKIVLLVVLGLIILAGAVYAGIAIGKKQSLPEVVPRVVEPSPTPDPTANWKTYTNTNFTIKIPPSVKDFSCDESSCWSLSTSLPAGARVTFIVGGQGSMFPDKSFEQIMADLKQNNVSYTEITIENKEAIKVNESKGIFPLADAAMEPHAYGLVINLGNNEWISFFISKITSCETECEELPPTIQEKNLFDQILSTFKFLD